MSIPPPPPAAPPRPPAAPPGAPHPRRGRTAGAWALSAVLVVAAWAVLQAKLPEHDAPDSFVTTTTVGASATTRNLALTVTRVRAARAVSDGAGWRAEGTWLVVDLDAAAVQDQFGATLTPARLRLGSRTFAATERGDSARGMPLITGVPRHGSVAFELPDGALSGPATLTFGADYTTAGDGVIDVVVDLDDVPLQDEAELDPIGWTR